VNVRHNLAIGAAIDKESQSTQKLTCPELKTSGKFPYSFLIKGLCLP
jgi:hypothetical protein